MFVHDMYPRPAIGGWKYVDTFILNAKCTKIVFIYT